MVRGFLLGSPGQLRLIRANRNELQNPRSARHGALAAIRVKVQVFRKQSPKKSNGDYCLKKAVI